MNNIVTRYKQAWEQHDISALKDIFHNDVYYQEHCNSIVSGIDELIAYWDINSTKQKDVSFTPLKVIEGSNEIVILWNATFYETIKQKDVMLEGIMWLSVENGKVKRLVEYFEDKNDITQE